MPFIGTRKYPKGPDLKRLEHHRITASGTEVDFLAPKHNNGGIPANPVKPVIMNLYEAGLFGRYDEQDLAEPPSSGVALKYWEFTGLPVVDGTGELGDMMFHVTISDMYEFQSLFRSRNLECAIERIIYASPHGYCNPGECRKNWQVRVINGTQWVSYQSTGYAGFRNAEECYETVWHTPITDQHLLTVRFDQVIRKKRTRLAEVYEKIIDLVMGSVKIQLSSDAKAQQAYIKQLYPDERLSEYLPPYQFEEIELLEELDLINLVSAENNHDLSIPDDIFDAQVQQKDQEQRRRAEETRSKILASHLRFTAPKEDSDPLNGCR